MDQGSAPDMETEATPIFGAYRRGYDPEQVDRYVADQRRRLDDALHRASESERKLGAAVGQLRELHRRVAVLESEERAPQTPAIDTLGERVQRILQEAWEGAYALRQSAEKEVEELRSHADEEVGELRSSAEREAVEIVDAAEQRSRSIDEEIERRRQAYLARIEEDRTHAVAQITQLHDQRKAAIDDLTRLKDIIEVAVESVQPNTWPPEVSASTPPPRSEPPERETGDSLLAETSSDIEPESSASQETSLVASLGSTVSETPAARAHEPSVRFQRATASDDGSPTMPVHRLPRTQEPTKAPDRAALVRTHRAIASDAPGEQVDEIQVEAEPTPRRTRQRRRAPAVFDFEAEESGL